jgi:aminoglycoside phosphotransferase (APT) family kinase protein
MDAECDTEAAREAAVVPFAVECGLTTPRLVAADPEFHPRPYTIYERAEGDLLGFLPPDYAHFMEAFRQMGRDLAALHCETVGGPVRATLRGSESYDFDKWIQRATERGSLDPATIEDVKRTVAHWRRVSGGARECLVHNDLHPWNAMVDRRTGRLTAILDWGDASFADPARDFGMMPLPCVPAMLAGYAEAGGDVDDGFVARSLVVGTTVALFETSTPEMNEFERGWWRMPPGGWQELKALVGSNWPGLLPSSYS